MDRTIKILAMNSFSSYKIEFIRLELGLDDIEPRYSVIINGKSSNYKWSNSIAYYLYCVHGLSAIKEYMECFINNLEE